MCTSLSLHRLLHGQLPPARVLQTLSVTFHEPALHSPLALPSAHRHGRSKRTEWAPVGEPCQQGHEVVLPRLGYLPSLPSFLSHNAADGQGVCGPGIGCHLHPGLL